MNIAIFAVFVALYLAASAFMIIGLVNILRMEREMRKLQEMWLKRGLVL